MTMAGLVMAMIIDLSRYNGREEPEWLFGINLSTLLATISTLMRAAMLVVIAEVLSQVKWSLFDRPRPLPDLHHHDQASRSILGSMKLFWNIPMSFRGGLGA